MDQNDDGNNSLTDDEYSPFNNNSVASYSECTGMIQPLPLTEEQAESYTEIYGIPKQQVTLNNEVHQKEAIPNSLVE